LTVLIGILYNNLLPVFMVAGAGYVFGRLVKPDIKATNQLALYVLSPCLVFSLIAKSEVGGKEFGQIAAFTVAAVLIVGGLAWLAARALRLNGAQTRAMLLPVMFVNSGNFGLAVTQLAFGDTALARAAVYFVINSLMVYTLGLYLAAGNGVSPLAALRKVLSVPPVYAVIAAGLVRVTGVALPGPILQSVSLIGQASIPVFLLILGMQLARVKVVQQRQTIGVAAVVRLVGGALSGLVLAPVFGLSGAAFRASVLEASMPAAVINTILASEHDVEPGLVSSIVMLTTLLSPITLTLVIAALK
jgi:predicted permease